MNWSDFSKKSSDYHHFFSFSFVDFSLHVCLCLWKKKIFRKKSQSRFTLRSCLEFAKKNITLRLITNATFLCVLFDFLYLTIKCLHFEKSIWFLFLRFHSMNAQYLCFDFYAVYCSQSGLAFSKIATFFFDLLISSATRCAVWCCFFFKILKYFESLTKNEIAVKLDFDANRSWFWLNHQFFFVFV